MNWSHSLGFQTANWFNYALISRLKMDFILCSGFMFFTGYLNWIRMNFYLRKSNATFLQWTSYVPMIIFFGTFKLYSWANRCCNNEYCFSVFCLLVNDYLINKHMHKQRMFGLWPYTYVVLYMKCQTMMMIKKACKSNNMPLSAQLMLAPLQTSLASFQEGV